METFSMVVLGWEYVTIYCWRPGVPTRWQFSNSNIETVNPGWIQFHSDHLGSGR